MQKERFNSLDGLRAISCLAIIAMHIQANTNYQITGYIWDKIIPSWTQFVPLFIMISGFSMCCGYLNRFIEGNVDLEKFYLRRYSKILPFFSFMILIAVLQEHTLNTLFEGSFELTLLFGLLPNNEMNVIGVCWTLGVIFLFYLLFPAFSVLMKSKKRAWFALIVSLWLVFICIDMYFGEEYVVSTFAHRHSFLYCLPYFCVGGLLYLYRSNIRSICTKLRWLILLVCVAITVGWYLLTIDGMEFVSYAKTFVMFTCWLFYAIGVESKLLQCKLFRYLSGISLELYLGQMVVFRGIEKLHLLYVLGDGWYSFVAAFIFTVLGLIVLIHIFKFSMNKLTVLFKKQKHV